MTIAIVTTGDEIVHGDTLNTNGQKIAQILSSEGFPLGLHLSCCDEIATIVRCLDFITAEHDILILIGGLGPTTDDLTRYALSEWTDSPLIEHEEALQHVNRRLKQAKVSMNPGNLQQCLFPSKAILLKNPHGSAMGCCYQWQQWTFFLLPGPPLECLSMFENHVLPTLQNSKRCTKHLLKWRIFGLAESEIAHTLEEALKDIDCHTGYRLDVPYIEFKVRCHQKDIAQVKAMIDPIVAPHCITEGANKASQALYEKIVTDKQKICIVDEATGGLLQTLITKPDSKALLFFSAAGYFEPGGSLNLLDKQRDTSINRDQQEIPQECDLFFSIEGLQEYWSSQPPRGETKVHIQYKLQDKQGSETHRLPYRSSLVLHYAVEWLSFRLLQIINQLHQGIA